MNNQTVTLGYWKIRGLAQQIRYLLEFLEVPYKEDIYSEYEEWTKAIPNLGMHFWNLPYLIDGELRFSETSAIMRYLARRYNKDLEGKTNEDFAMVEQMYGVLGDIKNQVSKTCYGDGDVGDIVIWMLWITMKHSHIEQLIPVVRCK